jgi:hypothetical protein
MEIFIGINQNCWKLNSQLVKNYLSFQTLNYFYKYTIKGVFLIVIPQCLKILKIKFENA